MQKTNIQRSAFNTFWLSVLLHLLLFIAIISFITLPDKPEKSPELTHKLPHDYVPAYTYTGSIKPSFSSRPQQTAPKTQPAETAPVKPAKNITENSPAVESYQNAKHSQSVIQVKKIKTPMPAPKKTRQVKSLLSDSLNLLREDQMRDLTKARESEPIFLIGDDSAPADPLIKLMGRSLSAHFRYPRTAGELGIKGRVLIELTLHPEGYYSDVRMVKSSSNQDLDAAALYAVNSAPDVIGADRFITKPRHFVVGFVFY